MAIWTSLKSKLEKSWASLKPKLTSTWTQLKNFANNPIVQGVWTGAKTLVPELNLVEEALKTGGAIADKYLASDNPPKDILQTGGNPFM
jgi:hypothetical protein